MEPKGRGAGDYLTQVLLPSASGEKVPVVGLCKDYCHRAEPI